MKRSRSLCSTPPCPMYRRMPKDRTSRPERHRDVEDLGEMVRQHLLHTTLLLGFLLQGVEMLRDEIAHRERWLEVQGQHAIGREDAQEHLNTLLYLLDATKAFIHSRAYPSRY